MISVVSERELYSGKLIKYNNLSQLNLLPVEIPPPYFRFNMDSPSGFVLNGGTISQWNDISGNGYNLSQNTVGLQPTLNISGINGYKSIIFNENYLRTSLFSLGNPSTFIYVLKPLSLTSYNVYMDGISFQSLAFLGMSGNAFDAYTNGSFWGCFIPAVLNNWCIVIQSSDTSLGINYIDNGTTITYTNNFTKNMGGITLGATGNANQNGNFEIVELIGYNYSLSSNDSLLIRNKLKSKYNI